MAGDQKDEFAILDRVRSIKSRSIDDEAMEKVKRSLQSLMWGSKRTVYVVENKKRYNDVLKLLSIVTPIKEIDDKDDINNWVRINILHTYVNEIKTFITPGLTLHQEHMLISHGVGIFYVNKVLKYMDDNVTNLNNFNFKGKFIAVSTLLQYSYSINTDGFTMVHDIIGDLFHNGGMGPVSLRNSTKIVKSRILSLILASLERGENVISYGLSFIVPNFFLFAKKKGISANVGLTNVLEYGVSVDEQVWYSSIMHYYASVFSLPSFPSFNVLKLNMDMKFEVKTLDEIDIIEGSYASNGGDWPIVNTLPNQSVDREYNHFGKIVRLSMIASLIGDVSNLNRKRRKKISIVDVGASYGDNKAFIQIRNTFKDNHYINHLAYSRSSVADQAIPHANYNNAEKDYSLTPSFEINRMYLSLVNSISNFCDIIVILMNDEDKFGNISFLNVLDDDILSSIVVFRNSDNLLGSDDRNVYSVRRYTKLSSILNYTKPFAVLDLHPKGNSEIDHLYTRLFEIKSNQCVYRLYSEEASTFFDGRYFYVPFSNARYLLGIHYPNSKIIKFDFSSYIDGMISFNNSISRQFSQEKRLYDVRTNQDNGLKYLGKYNYSVFAISNVDNSRDDVFTMLNHSGRTCVCIPNMSILFNESVPIIARFSTKVCHGQEYPIITEEVGGEVFSDWLYNPIEFTRKGFYIYDIRRFIRMNEAQRISVRTDRFMNGRSFYFNLWFIVTNYRVPDYRGQHIFDTYNGFVKVVPSILRHDLSLTHKGLYDIRRQVFEEKYPLSKLLFGLGEVGILNGKKIKVAGHFADLILLANYIVIDLKDYLDTVEINHLISKGDRNFILDASLRVERDYYKKWHSYIEYKLGIDYVQHLIDKFKLPSLPYIINESNKILQYLKSNSKID